ncbi:hypothetical protein F4814DRAFT_448694 [Daldinia grandis]|nr:hypothetical protein F4814DRAFT_448694 [Daldinia grandis]
MGIFSFIRTGMRCIALWWWERQNVQSTDACLWFVLGAIAGYTTQPEQAGSRLPFPGIFLKEKAYKDRSSYDKAVAKADYEWNELLKTIKYIKMAVRDMEVAKARVKGEAALRDLLVRRGDIVVGSGGGVTVRLQGLERQGLERARSA